MPELTALTVVAMEFEEHLRVPLKTIESIRLCLT